MDRWFLGTDISFTLCLVSPDRNGVVGHPFLSSRRFYSCLHHRTRRGRSSRNRFPEAQCEGYWYLRQWSRWAQEMGWGHKLLRRQSRAYRRFVPYRRLSLILSSMLGQKVTFFRLLTLIEKSRRCMICWMSKMRPTVMQRDSLLP